MADSTVSTKAGSGRKTPVPPGIRVGVVAAHDLICQIDALVHRQVEKGGDFDIPSIGRLVLANLPQPSSDEAVGFAFVLGEYLAFIAEGSVPYPNFTPTIADGWKGVRKAVRHG